MYMKSAQIAESILTNELPTQVAHLTGVVTQDVTQVIEGANAVWPPRREARAQRRAARGWHLTGALGGGTRSPTGRQGRSAGPTEADVTAARDSATPRVSSTETPARVHKTHTAAPQRPHQHAGTGWARTPQRSRASHGG